MQGTQEMQVRSWVRKIPWSRKWKPIPIVLPGKFHGQRSLAGYSPRGCKEVNTAKHTHICTHTGVIENSSSDHGLHIPRGWGLPWRTSIFLSNQGSKKETAEVGQHARQQGGCPGGERSESVSLLGGRDWVSLSHTKIEADLNLSHIWITPPVSASDPC